MPHAPDLSGCALDGRYELHAVIGEGAFGRVYSGLDRRLARPVAVKVIKPWWSEDPDWVGSFEREAQLLARVSDPGIVQIYDVGKAPEGLYYVSELVEGESLAHRLRRGPLAPSEALAVAEQLCRALARAHAERIVHRDVKPANILISTHGQVKVGDFGVARLTEGTTDGAATVVGTPRYMAPEQGRGLPTTPATDVYSVGVVVYEMLSGKPPFAGVSSVELALHHLQDAPPPLPADTPKALAEVVHKAMAKKPEKRYRDGGAMANALAAAGAADPKGGRRRGRGKSAPEAPTVRASRPAVRANGNRNGIENGDRGETRREAVPATAASTIVLGAPRAEAPVAEATIDSEARTRVADQPAAASSLFVDPPPRESDRTRVAPEADRTRVAPEADRTRVAPERTPRKNVDPPGRRRRYALLGLVLLLIAGMAIAGILLGRRGHVNVPRLVGMSRAAVAAELKRDDLHGAYGSRHSSRPAGIVIGQTPPPGKRVDDGSTVTVVLSDGPPPVQVPSVVGASTDEAQQALAGRHLKSRVVPVPAPGVRPGTVTRQSPSRGSQAPQGSTVTLSVAEAPRWRTLTSFSGTGPGRSVVFQILGSQFRVIYSMDYQGDCPFIVFCAGPPSAVVLDGHSGQELDAFDLHQGADRSATEQLGPGDYQLRVDPGSDSNLRYRIQIQDYY